MKTKVEPLPARIRRLRLACGLTQTALAEAIGRRLITVQRWEYGQHAPALVDCRRLAAALNVTLTGLVG